MQFTRQDFYTFLVGLIASSVLIVAQALLTAEQLFADPGRWGLALATGLLTSLGRYLLTYLAQKGFTSTSGQGH